MSGGLVADFCEHVSVCGVGHDPCVCVSLTCCKCESCLNLKFSWLQLMKEQRSLELGLSHEYQPKSIMMMGQTNDHNDDDNREYGKFLPLDVLAVGFSF